MSEPSRSTSSQIWRGLRWGLYLVLAGVVGFFALTRTEAGRSAVRQQVESAFNDQFAGTLRIGTLEGSLLRNVVATEVTLEDPSGRPLLSVDSVRAEPRWSALFGARLSVRQITLVRPQIHLHRQADSTWNVQQAFEQAREPSGGSTLDFSFADIEVLNGRVRTTRSGPAPPLVAERWLFDYASSSIDEVSLNASVEWSGASKSIDLQSASLHLPEKNLRLRRATGALTKVDGEWTLAPFRLTAGDTRLEGELSLGPSPRNRNRTALQLTLSPSRLNNDELQRLSPRLPLRDTLQVAGTMAGTLDQFVLNELRLSRGESSLALEGTAYGLPNLVDVDAQVESAQLVPHDVTAVWPGAPSERLRAIGAIDGTATVQGLVQWERRPRLTFDLEGQLNASAPAGSVQGSIGLERTATTLRYDTDLAADSLNLAAITGRSALESRLNGRLQFKGAGTSLQTATGSGRLALASSRVGNAEVAAASLRLTANAGTLDGQAQARQPGGGQLDLQGQWSTGAAPPTYEVAASTQQFDLADWVPSLPSSALTATLTADGRGDSWDSVTGRATLSVEPSSLVRGDSTISLPAHQMSLNLAPPTADRPRLTLDGTLATLSVDGPALTSSTRRTGRFWWTSLRDAVREEINKPLAGPPAADSTQRALDRSTPSLPEDVAPDSTVNVSARLAVHRMDLVQRWWPRAPRRADSLRADLSLAMHANRFRASGTVTANMLELGRQSIRGLDGAYGVAAAHDAPLTETLRAQARVHADSIETTRRTLRGPSAEFSLAERSGQLQVEVAQYGTAAPVRLATTLDLRDTRNRFQIDELTVGTAEGTWRLQQPGTMYVYGNALRFDSLNVENPQGGTARPQRIQVHGTFSSQPTDTLSVNTQRVSLYSLSQLAGLGNPIGGRLDGALAVTGGWSQPQVQSNFQVHQLSFDRRVLGTLHLRTEFAPDRPDLAVQAQLEPAAESELDPAALPPGGARAIEPSRLTLAGRVRLPGLTEPPDDSPRDQLDVSVEVERADLFFFEYIFDEQIAQVRGSTAGSIHVGGSFRNPVFDAQLRVEDGRFRLPQFGLRYGIQGPVEVDRKGIHLRSVTVSDDEGSALLNGSVLFNDYRYFSFDLAGELDEITIIDVPNASDLPFYGTIRASGRATLTGPLSDATLRSSNARTTPDSELFIPASQEGVDTGTGFIVFADSTGQIPNLEDLTRRDNILADRPAGEPSFTEGLDLDINVRAPEESTVHLVFDPVVGDVVTAQGAGRVQLQRQEGEFLVYGTFNVTEGTYQFTAGEVFVRSFNINEGTITWDGDPTNAQLSIQAEYRTRASPTGLPGYSDYQGRIPVRVQLDISGRVATPQVDLSLSLVRDQRGSQVGSQTLDAILNQPDRTTEYATSVLLTNTFLLTTESFTQRGAGEADGTGRGLSAAGNQLAFNSVSQLVASQLNRYLGAALPNVDLSFGLQGEDPSDLDIIYGVALRLLNERLVIRGEGVYTGDDPENRQAQGPQGEFVVEVRLTSRVSLEVFYRRAGDELTRGQTYTQSTGAGLSYQTEFPTWKVLFHRLFGWLLPDSDDESPPPPDQQEDPVARRSEAAEDESPPEDDAGSSSD